jgi:hypothetical protein
MVEARSLEDENVESGSSESEGGLPLCFLFGSRAPCSASTLAFNPDDEGLRGILGTAAAWTQMTALGRLRGREFVVDESRAEKDSFASVIFVGDRDRLEGLTEEADESVKDIAISRSRMGLDVEGTNFLRNDAAGNC